MTSLPSINGNIPSGHAFDLMGLSPPPGSPEDALLCCDGTQLASAASTLDMGLDVSILVFSACSRQTARLRRTAEDLKPVHPRSCPVGSSVSADSRRNVDSMLIDSVFKIHTCQTFRFSRRGSVSFSRLYTGQYENFEGVKNDFLAHEGPVAA